MTCEGCTPKKGDQIMTNIISLERDLLGSLHEISVFLSMNSAHPFFNQLSARNTILCLCHTKQVTENIWQAELCCSQNTGFDIPGSSYYKDFTFLKMPRLGIANTTRISLPGILYIQFGIYL